MINTLTHSEPPFLLLHIPGQIPSICLKKAHQGRRTVITAFQGNGFQGLGVVQ